MSKHRNSYVLFLGFLGACSLSGPLRVDLKASAYDIGQPPARWVAPKFDVPPQTLPDHIYQDEKSGAFLAMNSLCDRYPDSSLESLANQLMTPIAKPTVIKSESRTVDGREALFTHISGEVDGVAVEEAYLVLRKDNCIFDFTLDAKGKIPAQNMTDFENLVKSFHYAQKSSGHGSAP